MIILKTSLDIGAEFFKLDAEYDVLQEIKQHKNVLRDNDDEDNVEEGESEASGDTDADADDNNAADDENKDKHKHKNKDEDEDEDEDKDKDKDNKIRNRIESRTHGILIVQMEKDGMIVTPNKERFDNKDKIMTKEYRKIFRAEEDERFVKGWFCFIFSEPTKSYPKERKASEKVQQKLYCRLQKEFQRKVRITKKYLDNVGKADMVKQKQKQKDLRFNQQREAEKVEAGRWEKEKSEERQRQLQEKYQRLKQDREQKQQQQKQKQRKKKQVRDDDDDDTIMTKPTQESSLECEELECNLIDEEDDKYDSNLVIIPTQVLFRMRQNSNWKSKRKPKWQKEKYSRKVKMKKKIANMILNLTNGYRGSDDDVSKEHETKGILNMIDRRKLTKKKRVPNQWPDHPT